MRRRKFKLHTAFFNATMVSAIDAPVEFEVSIGEIFMSPPPTSAPKVRGDIYWFFVLILLKSLKHQKEAENKKCMSTKLKNSHLRYIILKIQRLEGKQCRLR